MFFINTDILNDHYISVSGFISCKPPNCLTNCLCSWQICAQPVTIIPMFSLDLGNFVTDCPCPNTRSNFKTYNCYSDWVKMDYWILVVKGGTFLLLVICFLHRRHVVSIDSAFNSLGEYIKLKRMTPGDLIWITGVCNLSNLVFSIRSWRSLHLSHSCIFTQALIYILQLCH